MRFLILAFLSISILFSSTAFALSTSERAEINTMIENYIRDNPGVMVESIVSLQAGEKKQRNKKGEAALKEKHAEIYSKKSPYVGNKKGTVKIVEFFDYQCGYCKKVAKDLLEIAAKDKNIKIIMKEMPILGQTSILASAAALAAHKQGKYAAFHQALMTSRAPVTQESLITLARKKGLNISKFQKDIKDRSIAQEISDNIDLATALGISGTPAFIVGDKIYRGALDKASILGLIKKEKRNK
ncbi:MAG: DsbA family protein [Alphaproteobacteria bacterium]